MLTATAAGEIAQTRMATAAGGVSVTGTQTGMLGQPCNKPEDGVIIVVVQMGRPEKNTHPNKHDIEEVQVTTSCGIRVVVAVTVTGIATGTATVIEDRSKEAGVVEKWSLSTTVHVAQTAASLLGVRNAGVARLHSTVVALSLPPPVAVGRKKSLGIQTRMRLSTLTGRSP